MAKLLRAKLECLDDDYSAEDTYFTYRPLSNLPTPPPSSRNSSAGESPRSALEEGEFLQVKYLGPAIHLVNLVPPSVSLTTPSVPFVQAMLSRSNLPLETIALAVCILDSLDSKFALAWRLQCPLLADNGQSSNKRHTLGHSPLLDRRQQQQMHIDSVSPELIILAALVIAVKFTEDAQDSTSYYCSAWGRNSWSHEQLNVTERSICVNINYRVKPLLDDEDLISDAMVDMQLAARQYKPAHRSIQQQELSHNKSMSVGTAVVGLGLQLTPIDTPKSEEPEEGHGFDHHLRGALDQMTDANHNYSSFSRSSYLEEAPPAEEGFTSVS